MVVDQEHDELPAAVADLETAADLAGEHLGPVDMFADVLGAPGVVEEDREVEGVGVLDLDEELAVELFGGVVGDEEAVELVDAAQGVLVGGVAVKELVLDQAVEGSELGEVAAQHPAAVHEAEGAGHLAFLLEDGLESLAVVLRVAEGLVDPVPVGLDQLTEGGRGPQVVFLAVQEELQQAGGVFLENRIAFGAEAALLRQEAVE